MSHAYALAGAGVPSSGLPAYWLQEPVATWLQGYLRHMQHWDWQPPPPAEICSNATAADATMELRIDDAP